MPISHFLEDFSELDRQRASMVSLSEEGLEDQRLDAFEQGYQAGWEDAIRAQTEERKHVSTELARNLQDLSFTYHEAFTAFCTSIKPLLQDVVFSVLPKMARDSLGCQIAEQLNELATQSEDGGVIYIAPANMQAVSALLSEMSDMSFSLQPDPDLAEGQVYLSVGRRERQIDMPEILQAISAAVSGFYHEADKELENA